MAHPNLPDEQLTFMQFKIHYEQNLSLFKRIVGPCTVMSKYKSPAESSIVSWSFCSY